MNFLWSRHLANLRRVHVFILIICIAIFNIMPFRLMCIAGSGNHSEEQYIHFAAVSAAPRGRASEQDGLGPGYANHLEGCKEVIVVLGGALILR